MVEQVTVNHLVVGSIPTRAAISHPTKKPWAKAGCYHAVYHAYILQNSAGRFYIGHTDDLDRRLSEQKTHGPLMGQEENTHTDGL